MCAVYMCMCVSVFVSMRVYRYMCACLCASVNVRGQPQVSFRCLPPCFFERRSCSGLASPVHHWAPGILLSLSLLLPLLVLQTGYYIRFFYLGARDQIQATFLPPLHSKSSLSPTMCEEIGNTEENKKHDLEFSSTPRESKVMVNSQINVQSKHRSVPWRQKDKAVYFQWGNQRRSYLCNGGAWIT